eukprot:CAMPEP_0198199338 /NCGR_PEP_ID=MMETSP1445-20131203/2654_1 /TAXON_ID=36898 /ORGANISM="Pyramimonas sp., Strain CCMP2087" /LENGTH=380 /DNA_ID=CAMNT_0043869161 /DNA_START=181 /DNA_END=1323 /DNA_ORIENTATION=-
MEAGRPVGRATTILLENGRRDLRTLPKAHLHLHMTGSQRKSTFVERCKKYNLAVPPFPEGLHFKEFSEFTALYDTCRKCIQKEEDLEQDIQNMAEDAATEGVRYLELSLTPNSFNRNVTPPTTDRLWEVIRKAVHQAEEQFKVVIKIVVTLVRTNAGPYTAENSVEIAEDAVTQFKKDGLVVGLGLAGPENSNMPPDPYEACFKIGREGGLIICPHAGETDCMDFDGVQYMNTCLEFGSNRIGHGIAAQLSHNLPAAQKLRRNLRDGGVCLEICPTSNVKISKVKTYMDHPLPSFLAQGIACCLNSDDPLLFNMENASGLLQEFETCRREMGLTDEQLASLAMASFIHSGADEVLKKQALLDIDAWLKPPPKSLLGCPCQ